MENDLIKRFAEIQGIEYAEAEKQIGAETDEEIMKKITDFTITKINGGVMLNRAQRRALAKKNKGNKAKLSRMDQINEIATKLNYIDLIQKLRNLNEKKEKENEENGSCGYEVGKDESV